MNMYETTILNQEIIPIFISFFKSNQNSLIFTLPKGGALLSPPSHTLTHSPLPLA